jgi:hypothetical protein
MNKQIKISRTIPEKNSLLHKMMRYFGFLKSSGKSEVFAPVLHTTLRKNKHQAVVKVQSLDTLAVNDKSTKNKNGNQALCPSAYACGARMYLGNR